MFKLKLKFKALIVVVLPAAYFTIIKLLFVIRCKKLQKCLIDKD